MVTGDDSERGYTLGTDGVELARLRRQHAVWLPQAEAFWDRAGFGEGDRLLDAGSGPGYTSLALAARVGASGHVLACDRSARFLAFLESERRRLAVTHLATLHGDIEALELDAESLDGAFARWLFCWLSAPRDALAAVARAVRPGGVVAIQDYLDWGTMRTIPASAALEPVVKACLRSFAEDGVTIDVCRELPELASSSGLRVEYLQPVARIGRVGASGVWDWLAGFFDSYLPRIVERGMLSPADHRGWVQEMERLSSGGSAFIQAPTVADLLLRKT